MKICSIENKSVRTIDLPTEGGNNENGDNLSITSSKLESIQSNTKVDNKTEINRDDKVLQCTWHPITNSIAVAGKTGICLYKA